MRTSTSILALIAFVSAASALNLNNGVSTVNVEVGPGDVGPGDVEASSAPSKRSFFNCWGSSRCSKSQDFKDQCLRAYNLIEDTIYRPGGGGASGVCSGNCGIFIQSTPGKKCGYSVTGEQLRDGFNTLRWNSCEACGSEINGACEITINYVTGC